MLTREVESLVAQDPALPLATLLDDEALGSWLGSKGGGVRSRYARYKPGTSCVVLVETVRDGVRAQVVVTGVAERARAKVAKALERARPDEIVAAEPDSGLLALRPAADRHLPGLQALLREPEEEVSRLLGRPTAVGSLSALAYKPHRRWVGRVDAGDGSAVLVRAYREHHGAPHAAVLETLRDAPAPVPRLLGYRRRTDLLALRWVPGEVLEGVVRDSSASAVAGVASAGSALARLHTLPRLDTGPVWDGASLRVAARAVGVLLPGAAGDADRLAARILDELPAPTHVTAHGDFSLDQVVLAASGPQLLDLDRLAPAPAALDLGTAAAALLADPERAHLAAPVLQALLEGYREIAAAPTTRELEVHTAAALLVRAVEPFRRCVPGWPGRVARTLGCARAVLHGGLDAAPRAVAS